MKVGPLDCVLCACLTIMSFSVSTAVEPVELNGRTILSLPAFCFHHEPYRAAVLTLQLIVN